VGDSRVLSSDVGISLCSHSISLESRSYGLASGLHGGQDGPVPLMEDAQAKCSRCLQLITADDTLAFEGHQILHLDCRRPRDLGPEERALLFRYCFDHAVAECPTCGQDFRQQELGADLVGDRSHLCPRCRIDLTDRLREHLYGCTLLPGEVRRRAREARAASRRLVKERQPSDHNILMREAEAAIAALRETMRQASLRA